MYKRRNEVERLFRRLKGYRRIFSRFEKLDVMFLGFISFVAGRRWAAIVLTGPSPVGILHDPVLDSHDNPSMPGQKAALTNSVGPLNLYSSFPSNRDVDCSSS